MGKNFLKEIGINVITLPNGLHVMDTHITNGQARKLGLSFDEISLADAPLVNISWNDVKDGIIPSFAKYGIQMRMLTDAEAEYIMRLNHNGEVTTGGFPFPEEELSKYSVYGQESVAPVKSKLPIYGLYDVRGNVWTWCEDAEGSDRVVRGGSFRLDPGNLRSAYRLNWLPGYRSGYVSVRLVVENYARYTHNLQFEDTLEDLLSSQE